MYLRRIPWIAVLFIVVLRVAIGWQLFYEGIWKTKTLSSTQPWTSAGYLRNSQGPMRDTFRNMTGDPDELDWLDAKKIASKWNRWEKKFSKHYRLSDRQKARLDVLVNGPKAFYSDKDALTAIPESVDLEAVSVISFDAENGLSKLGEIHIKLKDSFLRHYQLQPDG